MAGRRTSVLGLCVAAAMLVACGPRFPERASNAFVGQPTGVPSTQPSGTSGPATTAPTTVTTVGPRTTKGPTRTITVRGGGIPKGGVIKVGGLFPLTGGLSALGVPASRGAEAYFNWINEQGGVHGTTFKFIRCDDQAVDTQTTACAKKLVEQDDVFVMGPSFTPFSLTVIRQLEELGTPWVGFDGINIEGFDSPSVVTIGAPIEPMGHALLEYWFNKQKRETGEAPKNIGAVVLDSAPAQTYIKEARERICPRLGCTIVREQEVNYQTTQYGTICSNMINRGVDAIWIITDPASAVKLLAQCSSYKPKHGFLGQHGIYMDVTVDEAGRAANGILANSGILPPSVDAPATRQMKQVISRYFPDATYGYFTALSYASAQMLVDLVRAVYDSGQPLTRQSMLDMAKKISNYSCQGLCKGVNLAPPAGRTGGNHNVWIVRADFSSGSGDWVLEKGPIDAFRTGTWPCPGKPC